MKTTRRNALLTFLFGAGGIGLRSLATGIPISILANPRRALADGACPPQGTAQFLILSTSEKGDPIDGNVPGTYGDPKVLHPQDPSVGPTPITLRPGVTSVAAAPWATLPAKVLARTSFFHMSTNVSIHPLEPSVLALMGAVKNDEMFPSMMASQLGPCLGTVQSAPIALSANTAETLSFQGSPQPMMSPRQLGKILGVPGGELASLQKRRDADLDALNAIFKQAGNGAQAAFIDQYATSQAQVRSLSETLLSSLESITDDSPGSQIAAAVILAKMKVAPVFTIHIPFGEDNHADPDLVDETLALKSGVGYINQLMQSLAQAGLQDQVTFAVLNVFGRTMSIAHKQYTGRDHNPNHHCGIMIGRGVAGSVIGGITPLAKDYGALPINSSTGLGDPKGDIVMTDTMAAYGMTLGAALGLPADTLKSSISSDTGKIVKAALA